jgi:hypothetical protein
VITALRSRLPSAENRDLGVYAILYAALVVVVVGFAAIVVDIAGLRYDRRDNKAAADAAAIGAAEFLNPIQASGIKPDKACLRAWDYLAATLDGLTKPAGRCSSFSPLPGGVTATAYCNPTPPAVPAMIRDEQTVGNRRVIIAWPVPRGADQHFLDPELAPGSAVQDFSSDADGSDVGCDRVGVAIVQNRKFRLAAGIQSSSQNTSVHSVARFNSSEGQKDQIAALNILEKVDCGAITVGGGGQVLVGPTVNKGVVVSPGIVAIESDGSGTCSGTPPNGQMTIDPNASTGTLICASNVPLNATGTNCDGNGLMRAHALDPGGVANRAYDPSKVPPPAATANLKPKPTPEGGQFGYNPVTKLYGCSAAAFNPDVCVPPPSPEPNYIQDLVTAYGGTGIPTAHYGDTTLPNTDPYATMPWQTAPASVCPGGSGIAGTIVLAPGNWYIPCAVEFKNTGGTLIIQGGTVVIEGAVSTNNGCLVVNTPTRTTCPVAADIKDPKTSDATMVNPAERPTHDAIVFLRGRQSIGSVNGLDHRGKLIMPQTFVYAANAAQEVSVNSTDLTMWTAPGAGFLDPVTSRTLLEGQCWDPTIVDAAGNPVGGLVAACMNSRFARLVYWSGHPAASSAPNVFAGQGALSVVGVFFTPRAAFKFTGSSTYTATFAQFWARTLFVTGQAFLGLSPDQRTAIESPLGAVDLIR